MAMCISGCFAFDFVGFAYWVKSVAIFVSSKNLALTEMAMCISGCFTLDFCWICLLSKSCCDFGFLKKNWPWRKWQVESLDFRVWRLSFHQPTSNMATCQKCHFDDDDDDACSHWSGSPTDMYLDVTSRSKWVGEPDYFSHSSFQLFWFIKSSEAALEEAFKSGSHDFYIFSLSFQQKSKRCLRQNQFTCKCISELKRQWQRCIKVINGQVLVCTRRLGLVGEPRVDILHTNCILHQREKKGMTLRSF